MSAALDFSVDFNCSTGEPRASGRRAFDSSKTTTSAMKQSRALLVPICLVMLSCSILQVPVDEKSGSLVLTLSTAEMSAKTILPTLNMDIAYYDISGDGPDPATFSQSGVTGSTFVEPSLVSGAWTITVDAFNDDDYFIGTGSTGVSISAGQTIQAEIWVTPLAGTGVLSISVSWPEGTITDPVLSGTLAAIGGTPQSIPFTLGTDSAVYSYPSLDVGYYSLNLELADGAVHKWGALEWVRILKDQTTQAIFSLSAEDVSAY